MTKTSPLENIKHWWKNNMAINMATLYARGVIWMSNALDNFKPLNKNLTFGELQLWNICMIYKLLVISY